MAIDYIQGWQAMTVDQPFIMGIAAAATWANNLISTRGPVNSFSDITLQGFSDSSIRHKFIRKNAGQTALTSYRLSSTQGSLYLRFLLNQQEAGVTTIGARLARDVVITAYCMRVIGKVTNSAGTDGTSRLTGSNNFDEVYAEIQIDWTNKSWTVYINDVAKETMTFTTLTEVWIGSIYGYGSFPPSTNTGSSASWGLSKSGATQEMSDIYAGYDAPDEASPTGRLGPIVVRPIPLLDVAFANNSFVGLTKEEWLAKTQNYSESPTLAGIRTAGDGKKTVVSFEDITAHRLDGEEIIGFGITQLYTNFDPVKPTKFVGNITGPSGKDYTGNIEQPASTTTYANPLGYNTAVSGISEEDLKSMRLYMDMERANK